MVFKNKVFNIILTKCNTTALYWAVDKGCLSIVRLLLSNYKVDPNVLNILFWQFYWN